MSRVREILQDREFFHVEEHETVAQVARRMAEIAVGAILVMSGQELCGVFSERDLMRRVVVGGLDPETTPVRDVMTTDVVTIDEMAGVEDAMQAMQTNKCRHLPVTRGSRVVGFLSMRDLMNFELARQTEELHQMQAYIHGTS